LTGLAANAGLALFLGLSMQFIHKRVDAVVDFAFFHKRHEDERALLDFSKEAAFITNCDALLDQAVEKIERHTDARSAALLVDPHRYGSAIRGDLALPMLGRGKLLGVLLLGPRTGGEAYAPDEVEALTQFAHGVGVAMAALSTNGSDSIGDLRATLAAMQDSIVNLPAAIAREIRTQRSG
jgi:GAF domain-containing protein